MAKEELECSFCGRKKAGNQFIDCWIRRTYL